MARKGRSIGIVGDAFVPVPFQEMFKSNLMREEAYESAEDDILSTETLLGVTGATGGDDAYIQELEAGFESGLTSTLEETGGDLIGASSFLKKQLGSVTKAVAITEANKKAKAAAYKSIDDANLDPHIAQYKKLQADQEFDKAGGSRSGVTYGSGLNFSNLNANKVKKMMMEAAAKVSTDVSINGEYDLINSDGQNIYDIQRRVAGLQESVKNGTLQPEKYEAILNSLPPGWNVPDPRINGGQPIFSQEKTKAKYANTIFNEVGNVLGQDQNIHSYFLESVMGADFFNEESEYTLEQAQEQASKLFGDMLGSISTMMDVPEQAVTKSYPNIATKTEEVDSKLTTPIESVGAGLFTETPAGNLLNAAQVGSDGSFESMTKYLKDSKQTPEYQKVYAQSVLNLAAGNSGEDQSLSLEDVQNSALNKVPTEARISNMFKTEDGAWDVDKIQSYRHQDTAWMADLSWDEQNEVRSYKSQLVKALKGASQTLEDSRESFTGKVDASKTHAPVTKRLGNLDVDLSKVNVAAGDMFNTLRTQKQADFYVAGESNVLSGEDMDEIPILDGVQVVNFDKYPTVGDMTSGESFRTVKFKGTETSPKGKNKTHYYEVKVPEKVFQQGIGSHLLGAFKEDSKPYTSVHSDYMNLIARSPGTETSLPSVEDPILSKFQYASEVLTEHNIDAANIDLQTRLINNTHLSGTYDVSISVSVPYGNGQSSSFSLEEKFFSREDAEKFLAEKRAWKPGEEKKTLQEEIFDELLEFMDENIK